jgi:hypothetical protein
MTALIRKLWQRAWDIWDARNGILHNQETSKASATRDTAITAENTIGTAQLMPDVKRLFPPALQALLGKSEAVKQG